MVQDTVNVYFTPRVPQRTSFKQSPLQERPGDPFQAEPFFSFIEVRSGPEKKHSLWD